MPDGQPERFNQTAQILLCGGGAAAREADRIWAANRAALASRQGGVAELLGRPQSADLEWVFGRDRSLTARIAGRWWGGSSLPREVGRSLMKTLDLKGAVGCFLMPATAGQIRAVLEKITARQAIIVVMPEGEHANVALHCDDFSEEIAAGRLWVVCGDQWARQLAELLVGEAGLCVPQQYIRTSLVDDATVGGLLAVTNPIFAAENSRRSQVLAEIRGRKSCRGRGNKRVCVVAGSSFKLWDIAGPTLAQTLCRGSQPIGDWVRLDTDKPATSSALALGLAADQCDAILAADLFRGDLPESASPAVAWLTWVTRPRVAAPRADGGRDRLLLADPAWRELAAAAGWENDRVVPAGWPQLVEPSVAPAGAPLAMIADAPLTDLPEQLKDFSSHGVLWEQIAEEIAANPFCVQADIDGYLASRIARFEIDADSVDRPLFREKLILPAWRRGIARLIIKAGLPLVLFGAGWDETDDLAWSARGERGSWEGLAGVSKMAAAIISATPAAGTHPIQALGRPVVQPRRNADSLLRDARLVLAGKALPGAKPMAPLSAGLVLSLLADPSEN